MVQSLEESAEFYRALTNVPLEEWGSIALGSLRNRNGESIEQVGQGLLRIVVPNTKGIGADDSMAFTIQRYKAFNQLKDYVASRFELPLEERLERPLCFEYTLLLAIIGSQLGFSVGAASQIFGRVDMVDHLAATIENSPDSRVILDSYDRENSAFPGLGKRVTRSDVNPVTTQTDVEGRYKFFGGIDAAFGGYIASMGNTLIQSGNFKAGKQTLEKSLALQSDPCIALVNLAGYMHNIEGNHQKSKSYAQALVSLVPGSSIARTLYGDILRSLGRHEEAIVEYDVAHQLEAEYTESLKGKASSLTALGRTAEAQKILMQISAEISH